MKDNCISDITTLNNTIDTATNNYNMYKSKSEKIKKTSCIMNMLKLFIIG